MRSHNQEIAGDWNALELAIHEGRRLHIVNGQVVMALRNSRYIEDGKAVSLTEGQIQLQSEGLKFSIRILRLKSW